MLREDIYDGLFTTAHLREALVVHELTHIVLNHHVTCHRGAELGKHRFYEDSEWQLKAMTAAVMHASRSMQSGNVCRTVSCDVRHQQPGCSRYRLERLEKDGLIAPKGLFW